MKKLVLTLLAAAVGTSAIHAQGDEYVQEQMNRIVPVSPNAAALGIFGSIPVGHYTGVPDISIPLYEIKSGDLTLPINLSYHASGVKVAQEASSVGLGWTLIAGGCITRTIKHLDDFGIIEQQGFYWGPESPPPPSPPNLDDPHDFWHTIVNKGIDPIYEKFVTGRADSEPDIYNFNFGSYSGSCFLKPHYMDDNSDTKAKAIIINSKEYIDITCHIDENDPDCWIIYDAYGNKYTFKDKERTKSYYGTFESLYNSSRDGINEIYQPKPPITAWFISEIESPLGNKIKFLYEDERIYSPIFTSEDAYFLYDRHDTTSPEGAPIVSNLESTYQYYGAGYSVIKQLLLKKIVFEQGEIELDYTPRSDIEVCDRYFPMEELSDKRTASKIECIKVKDKQENIIKTINFSYSYSGQNSNNNYNSQRLMLDKVSLNGNGSELFENYDFSYDEGCLPEKTSNSTDYWGYYTNSESWLDGFKISPPMAIGYFNASDDNYETFVIGGLTKSANNERTQYGILKSIRYPTGGKTTFEYELHDFPMPDFSTNGYELRPLPTKEAKAQFTTSSNRVSNQESYVISNEITIEETTECSIDYHCNFYSKPISDRALFTIEKKYGTEFMLQNSWGVPEVKNGHLEYEEIVPNVLYTCTGTVGIRLRPGTYRVKIIDESWNTIPYNLIASMECIDYTISPISSGGGLRIKTITNYSKDNEVLSSRAFNYKRNGLSSGILMTPPIHHQCVILDDIAAWRVMPSWLGSSWSRGGYINGSTSSLIPIAASALGRYVGYSYVEEKHMGENDNGYTSYTFENKADSVVLATNSVRFYPTIPSLRNGRLLSVEHYDHKKQIKKNNVSIMNVHPKIV